MNPHKCRAGLLFQVHRVDGVDVILKVMKLFLGNGDRCVAFPREFNPIGDNRNGVFATHAEAGIVGHKSRLLPAVVVSGVVASDDAIELPPFQFS